MGENVLKFGTYVRVGNAAEAYELLQKNRNNKIVGGGIWMRLGSRRVATAIDLSACGLDQIEETETEFRIGAMCTLRQLERHAGLNALVNNVFEFAVHDIVGVQLRNTATVGGSIYGRFGFSDVLSAFLALDSYVELTGAGRVPLAEFVNMGYRCLSRIACDESRRGERRLGFLLRGACRASRGESRDAVITCIHVSRVYRYSSSC